MKNEKTSKSVSKIAGKILAMLDGKSGFVYTAKSFEICSVAELKSLAASALTQTADKRRS